MPAHVEKIETDMVLIDGEYIEGITCPFYKPRPR